MLLLHPFMPFVTEEIYHHLKERKEGDDITIKVKSEIGSRKSEILRQGELLKEVITALRDVRAKNQLKNKEAINLNVQTESPSVYKSFEKILSKQINAATISYFFAPDFSTINTVVQKDKLGIKTETQNASTVQKEQLHKDLEYQKGFLLSVDKKLSNDRFVQNAKPEVIEIEKKKKADAEAKIKAIEESLAAL
jgi:valyl-tRNA synthetase